MESNSISTLIPLDLERRIFEIAFNPVDQTANSLLILTASRVRDWLRPLRYRICYQRHSRRFPNFETIPSAVSIDEITSFIRYFDTNLLDGKPKTLTISILEKCHNLECLVSTPVHVSVFYMVQILPVISTFQSLQRLHAQLGDLTKDDLLRPIFQSITHLELSYAESTWSFDALRSMKQLTHVMVYGGTVANGDPQNVPVLSSISTIVENLRVYILCTAFLGTLSDEDIQFYTEDTRRVLFDSVMRTSTGLMAAAQGESDVWQHAEDIVIARQRGYFGSNEYLKYPMSSPLASSWYGYLTDEGKQWLLRSPAVGV